MNAIAAYRKRHGLSQRELAKGLSEATGRPIRHQAIGRMEAGGEIADDVYAALGLADFEDGPDGGEGRPSGTSSRREDDAAHGRDEQAPQRPGLHGIVEAIPSGDFEKRVREFYETVGGLVAFLDPLDGMAVASIAGPAAHAWTELAKKNPGVARVWNKLTAGGDWTQLAVLHGTVAVAVLSHHGVIPELRLIPRTEPTHGQSGEHAPEPQPSPDDGADAHLGAPAAAAA